MTWVWGDAAAWPRPATRNPEAVFLLGVPRSGTTLLRVMLDRSERLFAPPELMLLPFRSMGERRRLTEQYGYEWARRGLREALAELGLDPDARIAAWEADDAPTAQVYGELQSLCAPRLLVDKTPANVGRLENLLFAEEVFVGARYLVLVRHPCAVVESFVRMGMQGLMGRNFGLWDDDPGRMAAEVWGRWNSHALALLERVGDRGHLVRYEDLVAEPRAAVQGICGFLGIPVDEAMLRPYEGDGNPSGLGDWNLMTHDRIDPAQAEKWRAAGCEAALTPCAREVAARLGYVEAA